MMLAMLVEEPSSPAPAQLTWRNRSSLAAYVFNSAFTYASLTGVFGATNTELSKKYQTLVTPAGFAFSIWGPIFIAEGFFAVAQMLPRFRGTAAARAAAPWWWAACLCQVCWTLAFAQEVIPLSLVCMLGILVCLLGVARSTDALELTCAEYWLLRAPFSLHLGWIIAASAVNASVQADAAEASPQTLLGLAVSSDAVICTVATCLAVVARRPDAIACLVVAWAFGGIYAELGNPENLDSPDRFNPYIWDRVTLGGLRRAALGVVMLALGLAVLAAVRTALIARRDSRGRRDNQPASFSA
uniref:Uncharacterized protein n=1 Tax=Alexandrium monilatum TaxID=311494 RepID=A0A7S4VBY4_9DINO